MMRTWIVVLALLAGCGGDAPAPSEKTEEAAKTEAKTEAKADMKTEAKAQAKPPAQGDIPAPPDVAAPPADAKKTESGLAYKVLQAGKGGDKPSAESTVSVHYTGWTTDGKMFDSSKKRGHPATFPLNGVIAGWTEGLQLMSKGDSYRLWIPEEQAYQGKPGRPAGMLVFDVELLEIAGAPKPPAGH